MPAIHIQISSPHFDAVVDSVAQSVLGITERVLSKDRAVTAIFIDEISASRWWIGDRQLKQANLASYCLTIRITDETNTKAEKAHYIDEVHRTMSELLGPLTPCSYVHVHDVRAAAYGYGGQTQERRYQALQTRSTCSP
jgi:4-oxalocrotonate tautomerase